MDADDLIGPPRLAGPADAALVTRILVDAFHEDPMWGAWAFPDLDTRREHREKVFGLLVQGALRYPHVWVTADEAAASIWIPPGGTEMSAAQEDLIDSVLRESLGDRAQEVLEAFELFETARPTSPHYYLTLLGTDPRQAGQGIGQRLLRANLAELDRGGHAAYLEAADELVPLYRRFGFRVTSRFDLAGGPTVNTMWRDPAGYGPRSSSGAPTTRWCPAAQRW